MLYVIYCFFAFCLGSWLSTYSCEVSGKWVLSWGLALLKEIFVQLLPALREAIRQSLLDEMPLEPQEVGSWWTNSSNALQSVDLNQFKIISALAKMLLKGNCESIGIHICKTWIRKGFPGRFRNTSSNHPCTFLCDGRNQIGKRMDSCDPPDALPGGQTCMDVFICTSLWRNVALRRRGVQADPKSVKFPVLLANAVEVVVPDWQSAVMFFQSSCGTTCIRDVRCLYLIKLWLE